MAVTSKAIAHMLAGDSWIALTTGVKHVRGVRSGDELAVVHPDGTFGATRVGSVGGAPPGPCISLLAAVGEILLPVGARVVTRAGIEKVTDVAAAADAGRAARLEVVRPIDLFGSSRAAGSKKVAYQAAVAAFPRTAITIPGWLDEDQGVAPQVEDVLRTAAVSFDSHRTDDWRAFTFERPTPPPASAPWIRPADQAEAIRLLTAWTFDDGRLVSRLLFREVAYLQRLTGCLAGARRDYQVKWVPAYCPMEVHVTDRVAALRSHVPVTRAVTRSQDLVRLEVDCPGSTIVGLALAS
jgi:hypothetical protein